MANLFSCNFPLYTIDTLDNGEFYVAGGGGQAKTGVPNSIEFHSIFCDDGQYTSKCILQQDMKNDLIMNSVPHPKDSSLIAASIGHSSVLLKINKEKKSCHESVCLNEVSRIRTDFNEGDSYQNSVCFNYNGSLMITGGSDGILRVWKFPNLHSKVELRGHNKEIEHISCHSCENQVVSICRGGEGLVWDLKKFSQIKKFTWQSDKYRLKSCRLGLTDGHEGNVPSGKLYYYDHQQLCICLCACAARGKAISFSPKKDALGKHWLFSINVPIKWSMKSNKTCFLLKWCASTWHIYQTQTISKELACTMAISSVGSKIAVGTTEGNVSLFNSDLKLLMKIFSVHSIFITGMTFINPDNVKTNEDKEVLLSISADRNCCVTRLSRRGGGCPKVSRCIIGSLLLFWTIILLLILLMMLI